MIAARLKHAASAAGARLDAIVDGWRPDTVARVAINRRPVRSPWGGGNQWLDQIVRSLRMHGYSVRFELDPSVDCILLVDPRSGPSVTFDVPAVASFKSRHPHAVCIQRVNENDRHRKSDFRDALQAAGNSVADHTVFVSAWLRDYASWFDRDRPHSVILNGADPAVFHPVGRAARAPDGPLRIVTHHWSDNWNKGFAVYAEIDELISRGALDSTELWVIGRWPADIRWRSARTFPSMRGPELARHLRQCHVYVTASVWESGPMHFVEGIQCGLPVLYHTDGGGIVEVAKRFGVGFNRDVRAAISEIRERYPAFYQEALMAPPGGDRMCLEYRSLIQRMIACRQRGNG